MAPVSPTMNTVNHTTLFVNVMKFYTSFHVFMAAVDQMMVFFVFLDQWGIKYSKIPPKHHMFNCYMIQTLKRWPSSHDDIPWSLSVLHSPWSPIILEICCVKEGEVLLQMEGQFPDCGLPIAKGKWGIGSTFHSTEEYGYVAAFIQLTHGILVV